MTRRYYCAALRSASRWKDCKDHRQLKLCCRFQHSTPPGISEISGSRVRYHNTAPLLRLQSRCRADSDMQSLLSIFGGRQQAFTSACRSLLRLGLQL